MRKTDPILALLHGFRFCVGNRAVRKLALIPWGLGAFAYLLFGFLAVSVHDDLVGFFISDVNGFWQSVLYYLAWVLAAVILLVLTIALSFGAIMLIAGSFQSAIARKVFQELGQDVGETGISVRGALAEVFKLGLVVVLMVFAFVLGFIPFLTPLALLMSAWLVGFEFFDVVLEALRLGPGARLSFAFRRSISVSIFGGTVLFLWAIPFVGMLLPPVAVSGAAWLAHRLGESPRA